MTVSGYLVLRWVSLLLDVTVKSALLLAGAGACLLLLRRASAATRHLVWMLTFASLLCLPFLTATLPGWHARAWPHLMPAVGGVQSWTVAHGDRALPTANTKTRRHEDIRAVLVRRSGWTAPDRGFTRSSFTAVSNSPAIPLRVFVSSCSLSEFRVFALSRFRVLKQSVATFSTRRSGSPTVWPATLLLIWLAGAAAVLAQVGVGIAQVRRMGRRCPRVTEGPLVALLRELNREVGQPRPVILRLAPEDSRSIVPMTWGWVRPVVLLPADAAAWPEERLRSVLLHELAHVRRGDWPVQLLTYAACALYWCHPLVWLAARQMRLESERACDDRVLAAGIPGPDYAAHLLEIIRALRGRRRPLPAALTAAPQSPIERRLRSILEERRSRRAAPRWAVPLALAIAAGTVIPLAGVHPVDEIAPKSANPRMATVSGKLRLVHPPASHNLRVAILETTGHPASLEQMTPSGRHNKRLPPVRQSASPHRLIRAPRIVSPAISRPRQPGRPARRFLAILPPASLSSPAAIPAPEPVPHPTAVPVPAGFVRADSDAEDAGTTTPVAAALTDDQPATDAGEPAPAGNGAVSLAAAATREKAPTADTPRKPEQDTADLPAAGQDRDVFHLPAIAAAPGDDPGIRWAAQKEAIDPPDFVAQEVLVWDTNEGQWVRLLLIWDRAQPGSRSGRREPDAVPAAAVDPSDPDADSANDLTEPGANAGELPLWERFFDRWEKALANRQHPCPPTTTASL